MSTSCHNASTVIIVSEGKVYGLYKVNRIMHWRDIRQHEMFQSVCERALRYIGRWSSIFILRRGVFTCVGWQVTLCDPIWQVTLYSCVINSYTVPLPLPFLH